MDGEKLERVSAVYHAGLLSRLRYAPVRAVLCALLKRANAEPRPFTARTFWGRQMTVYLPEEVSQYIYRFGLFEPGLTRAFCSLLKPDDVFFDIGAHFGYFSLLASQLVGPEGRVHAFEPARFTFDVLAQNLCDVSNVRCNRTAIWNAEIELQLNDFGVKLSAFNSFRGQKTGRTVEAHETYSVPAITIDRYVSQNGVVPTVIKVDAENAEYEVVEGMRETMKQYRSIVTLEVGYHIGTESQKMSREAVLLAESFGYRAMEYIGSFVPHNVRETYEYDNLFMVPAELVSSMKERAQL